MRFDILTLFPEVVTAYIDCGVLGRAKNIKGVIDVGVHDIRDYTKNAHKKVDDTPFGGGAGMVIQVEPIYYALDSILETFSNTKKHIVFFKAGAEVFTHNKAISYANTYDHIIFICGRYEGIDYRVENHLADESLSIGQYVLTGGELPALIVLDAVSRHIPQVLGNNHSAVDESWSGNTKNEYPQYTKPRTFIPPNPHLVHQDAPSEWTVPETLVSGDHQAIAQWRKDHTT